MTKSITPKEKNLKKPTPKRRGAAGGGGSPALDSGFQTSSTDKQCIIRFRTSLLVKNAASLDADSDLTLLPDPHSFTKLNVIQKGRIYGEYTGEYVATIIDCMKLGYIYRAKIIKLDSTEVVVEVRGEGA